eukprot:CAMPEP_0180038830 /NCGR_PEP_ID=MMETSP0984-20121128/32441_1 /TAXON_ID=483367 /ORGANISM="non described non described, Strain CCMP 2436" /LENGTH=72 /DNA_ID=CAMNT_0021965641 /DNA_START=521 /DNA_END=739 /DNA_ORIENTATION=+
MASPRMRSSSWIAASHSAARSHADNAALYVMVAPDWGSPEPPGVRTEPGAPEESGNLVSPCESLGESGSGAV